MPRRLDCPYLAPIALAMGIVVALPAPVRAQVSTPIEIRAVSDGRPLDTVEVRIPINDSSAAVRLMVSNTGDRALHGVSLETLINGAAVTITQSDGSAGQQLDIPGGGHVIVDIRADLPGGYSAIGELLFEGERLAHLIVQRESLVRLLGVGAEGLILTSDIAAVAHPMHVESSAPEATKVRIAAHPFASPGGSQTLARLESGGLLSNEPFILELPAGGLVPIALHLEAPLAGRYEGALQLDYLDYEERNRPLVIPVAVTRRGAASTVAFDTIADTRVESATAVIPVTIHETAGRHAHVDQLLVVAVRERTEEGDFTAEVGTADFRDGAGLIDQSFTILPGGTKQTSLHIEDMPRPGRYEAKLRLATGGGLPVFTSATVFYRQPVWLFVITIAFALAISGFVRWCLAVAGPRLVMQKRISAAAERLKEYRERITPTDPRVLSVLERLRGHLGNFYLLAKDDHEKAEPGLLLAEKKLERVLDRWVRDLRRAKSLSCPRAEAELQPVETYLQRYLPGGDDPENLTLTAEQDLTTAEKELETCQNRLAQGAAVPPQRDPTPVSIPSVRWMRARVLLIELGVFVVAGAVAVLLGHQLLYSANYTWGTWDDIFVALLWGLGMQQVGGKTFEGLGWIRRQLGPRPSGS